MSEIDSYYLPHADWSLIPDHMHGAMVRYVMLGVHPGSFLSAVLTNDLKQSVACADHENRRALVGYVEFLWNYAPMQCSGSYQNMEEWMRRGGIDGLQAVRMKSESVIDEIGR